jgi:hypothetical protein
MGAGKLWRKNCAEAKKNSGNKKTSQVLREPSDEEAVARHGGRQPKKPAGKTVFRPLIEAPATWMLRKSNAPHGATHGKS